jgi:hypothetical protein
LYPVINALQFDCVKPWLILLKDADALDISSKEIKDLTQPHFDTIMQEQKSRKKKQQKN